jgi:CBS domain-containing protein
MTHKRLRTVEDFMTTAVISLKESATVEEARAQMQGADIRHVPIVDGRFKPIGVLSSHDFLKDGARPEAPVANIMTRRVLTVRSEDPAFKAADLMIQNKISSLPVVDEMDVLIGIVTATDLLVVARQALEGVDMSRTAAEL